MQRDHSGRQRSYDDELSKSGTSHNNKTTNHTNSKFIKIAKNNYLQDKNLRYSLLEKKYSNRKYSEDREDEEYIYLYKESSNNYNNNWIPSASRNQTPETAKLEIFNLYNQVNLLKNENYFLNQKVFELNHEVVRLQKLNLQFTNYINQNEIVMKSQAKNYTTSFNLEPISDTASIKTGSKLALPSSKTSNSMDKHDMFNMEEFINETLTEFENYK